MKREFNLDHLDYYDLEEMLLAVKYQFGLDTELEAMENIEYGEYSEEEILNAIAYYRAKDLGTHKIRMNFLPTSLKYVKEDYAEILIY